MMRESRKEERHYEKMMQAPANLLREAVKLAVMLEGGNITNFDEMFLEVLSPRLFSVVPDEDIKKKVRVFSPSLFSLHGSGHKDENETSLAEVVSKISEKKNPKVTLDRKEYDAWLNFIMEASGAADALNVMKNENNAEVLPLKDDTLPRSDSHSLYLTKDNVTTMLGEEERLRVEVFERLQASLTDEQV
ncbi:hypothetical protein GCK32_012316 [Trichostrongylus colubriformis]|uniref:Uncharacterized protein n=1 Tax=Trichostrongylus colubriformis TaxID=6319 RepID=A0AAN8FJG0_TRICO